MGLLYRWVQQQVLGFRNHPQHDFLGLDAFLQFFHGKVKDHASDLPGIMRLFGEHVWENSVPNMLVPFFSR